MVDFFGWTTRGIPFPRKHMATRDQDEAKSRTHSPTINLTVSSLYWYPSIKQRTFCPMLWKIPGSHGDCSWTHYWKPHRFPGAVGNLLGCCRFIYDWLRAGQNWASLRDFRASCIRNWFSFCVINVIIKKIYIYTYVILLFMKNKRPVQMKLFCVMCFKTSTLDTCQVDHSLAPSCSLYQSSSTLFCDSRLQTATWEPATPLSYLREAATKWLRCASEIWGSSKSLPIMKGFSILPAPFIAPFQAPAR